ncbi:hypothetical protein HYV43_05935 [Candidatus Micrarchaeota archaeon]|nr:hypothetical protein [Candidatus Micrarchaeota archaeon]
MKNNLFCVKPGKKKKRKQRCNGKRHGRIFLLFQAALFSNDLEWMLLHYRLFNLRLFSINLFFRSARKAKLCGALKIACGDFVGKA